MIGEIVPEKVKDDVAKPDLLQETTNISNDYLSCFKEAVHSEVFLDSFYQWMKIGKLHIYNVRNLSVIPT